MDEQEHMRRCLVRQLLAWRHARGVQWFRGYVAEMKQWNALKSDFAAQWNAGNRGEVGDWR